MTGSAVSSRYIMVSVILAACPGGLVMAWFFGSGIIINLLAAMALCMVFEASILQLRKKPVSTTLLDGSAMVTGLLLGLSMPPLLPWWMLVIACFFAIVIAKQLFGGIGQNLFNPAMVGYAILLISFPLAMSTWPQPRLDETLPPDFYSTLLIKLSLHNIPDGFTMATPLDLFKHRPGLTAAEIWQQSSAFGLLSGRGWEWINAAFLLGGSWLVYRKIARWQAVISFMASLGIMAALFYDNGSSASHGSVFLHWFGGATMLGAFFILTDPATAPDTGKGLFWYGMGAGILVYILRVWGAYPDGIAFAILLMNMATPVINQLTLSGIDHTNTQAQS